jgi:hypothetical protein
MAEFSLGAAIGATGKFPKYTAPEQKGAFDEKDRDELERLKAMVAADKKVYHNAYLNDVKDLTASFYKTYFDRARRRDPEIVQSTYQDKNVWDKNTDEYVLKSAPLFALEKFAQEGKAKGLFVPKSIEDAAKLTRSATSKADLMKKIEDNSQIFLDGYVTVDKLTGALTFEEQKAIDFENYVRKELLTKDKAGIQAEFPSTEGNIKTTVTRTTIPRNRLEAAAMREFNKQRYKQDVGEVSNAYDLGYTWFTGNPTAIMQYASLRLAKGDTTAVDKTNTPAKLYEDFYEDFILPNIPSYDKTGTQYIGSRNINITNIPAMTTPANFQVADRYTINYAGGDGIIAKRATVLSKDPSGTQVLIPVNKHIINMETGKSAFKPTDATQRRFYISTVAVMPSVQMPDGTFKPVGEKEMGIIKTAKQKVLYLPWALADEQQLNIGMLPTIGKSTYAIPLFEPTNEGGKTKMIIPKEYRTGDKIEGGSLILGALFQNQKLDKIEAVRWKEAFRKLMNPVRDSNEAVTPD